MIDEIDTNSNFSGKEIPDGRHTFRVLDVEKKGQMYIWGLSYDVGKEGEIVFFANAMGGLLKVLGCPETSKKGVYAFDSDKVRGDCFNATVFSVPDKNDSSKIYKRMKDFEAEVPFA